jgi:hypothetical protein
MEPQVPGLSKDLMIRSLERLTAVATDDALLAAFNEAALDQELWRTALGDLEKFLLSRDVQLPEGIHVSFTDTIPKPWLPPEPDLQLVVVRTFWVCYRDRDDGQPGPMTCERFSLVVPRTLVKNL